jgi:hypothetical protein
VSSTGKAQQRAANLLNRIKASVDFWKSDKGEDPSFVSMSLESYCLILPPVIGHKSFRHGAAEATPTRSACVFGVCIQIDNTLAEGSYRVN